MNTETITAPNKPNSDPTTRRRAAANATQQGAHPVSAPNTALVAQPSTLNCSSPGGTGNGELLLNDLRQVLNRFVVLPTWATKTAWILHTPSSP
jgi:hypothetical protein